MNEELCWQAVLERDQKADGTFVYAVRSTGIYCRPSCPSRRPHRDQVVFFARPELAGEAGFRECLRCQPRGIQPQVELAQRICHYIENNLDGPLTLDDLSQELNVSPHHLQRVFKKIMGVSPRQYAEAYRLNQLKARLREGEAVTSAIYEAGYGSSSRLYERAPQQLGMTPAAYRKGGNGMSIEFAIVDSPLGKLLVAATERGVCSVAMGDEEATLEAALRKEFPNATLQRQDRALGQWVEQILEHLNGRQTNLDLPLAITYTPFQKRVWDELRSIPYGSTRSYSQVAQAIGQPTAMRAVARACATNPVALIIPCHRVIREGGDLGGYRWGLERKRALLNQEGGHESGRSAAPTQASFAHLLSQ